MTAIHEAGHAVAHLRLHERLYIGKVTVVPGPERLTAGHSQFEELDSETSDDWSREVVILCAGFAAQVLFGDVEHRALLGASSDLETAEEIIKNWNLAPLAEHIATAMQLINRPKNKRAESRTNC